MDQQANEPIPMPTDHEVREAMIEGVQAIHGHKISPELPLSSYIWFRHIDVLELIDRLRHQFRFRYPDREVNVLRLHGMTPSEIAAFVLPYIRKARENDPQPCKAGTHKPVNPTNRRPWQEQALQEEICIRCGRQIKRMRSGWYLVNKEREY